MRDEEFRKKRRKQIKGMVDDRNFAELSREWFGTSVEHGYSYNFDWLGLPVIQYPQDTVLLQELIWAAKPDLIIETGVARGGSLVLSASMMVFLDLEKGQPIDVTKSRGTARVVGVELALSDENRQAIMKHVLSPYIALIDGSSTAPESLDQVRRIVSSNAARNPLVLLDSDHSHSHVLAELSLYSKLVPAGGFIVVMDTVIEELDQKLHNPKRWGKGDNPRSAVSQFLSENPNWTIDEEKTEKLMISVAPKGVLKRLS